MVFTSTTFVPPNTTMHIVAENKEYEKTQKSDTSDTTSTSSISQDVQVLLANARKLVTDNDIVKDEICDAINKYNDL